jgi:glycosyltransferase involved in cell wall biosynthesis
MITPVSVIVITLNEEQNIENCLKSVNGWSDDIHVIDSHSTDSTVEISKKFTNNIHQLGEGHWADLRNWAIKNLPLKHEWLLFLDADERLTQELKVEISNLLRGSPRSNGFYIRRRFIFMGRWLKHGDCYPKVLRFFKREFVSYVEFGDSEYAIVKGNVGLLGHDMIHEDRKSISRWVESHNKKAEREAKRFLQGKKSILIDARRNAEVEGKSRIWIRENIYEKIPLQSRPVLLFLYQYIFKLGFLDGLEGFVYHAFVAFWYRLLIYVKVRELLARSEPVRHY